MGLLWIPRALLSRWTLLPASIGAVGMTGCSHHHHDYHERQRVVVLRDDRPRHGYYDADGCWHEYARYDDRRDYDRHHRDEDRYRRWDRRRDGRYD